MTTCSEANIDVAWDEYGNHNYIALHSARRNVGTPEQLPPRDVRHGKPGTAMARTPPDKLARATNTRRLRHLQKSGRPRGEGLTWRRRTRAFRTRYDGKGAPQDRILGSYVPFTCSGRLPSSSHLPTSSASRQPTLNAGRTKQAIAKGRHDYDQTVNIGRMLCRCAI